MGYRTPTVVALHVRCFLLAGRAAWRASQGRRVGFLPERDFKKRRVEKQHVFKWEDKPHEKQVGRKTQVRTSDLEYAAHLPVSAVTSCLKPDKPGLMLRTSARL